MGNRTISVTVPWKYLVSKNNKTILRKGRRPALSKAYREGKKATSIIAQNQYNGEPIDGRVEIDFYFYPPDRRRRDVFNYTQMLCDGLNDVLYVDDWQIDEGHVHRMDKDKDNPRVVIEVKEIKCE